MNEKDRRFLLYKDYESGLCNELMSVELAVGIAHLTRRTLVYYGALDPQRNLHRIGKGYYRAQPGREEHIDDTRGPTIMDLLEPLPVHVLPFRVFKEETRDSACTRLDSDIRLVRAVFVDQSAPIDKAALEAFAEGRLVFADPYEDIFHLTETNLGYYSRLFFSPTPSLYGALGKITIRKIYRDLADSVCRALGSFNGVHVRLRDFRQFLPHRGEDYPRDILSNLSAHFSPDDLLVISTDESDNNEFFRPVISHYQRHVFIDEFILREFGPEFKNLPFRDEVTLGLLCNLVLQRSTDFLGTPGSTFTGIIQRQIALAHASKLSYAPSQAFKFITGGSATPNVPFRDGVYLETCPGRYSWNRLDWSMDPETKSWYREWPESVPARATSKSVPY